MEFKDVIAVSGKPGLYELVKARPDGLIVRNLNENNKSFLSSRKHTFTPLENIGVFEQNGDTMDLKKVLLKIKDGGPTPDVNTASPDELRSYFITIMPDYDEEMVKLSDIKKMISWYSILDEQKLLTTTSDESEEE